MIYLDGLQVSVQLPLDVIKWPLPGPSADVIGKTVILDLEQGCLVCLIVLDGVQAAAQVPLEAMKWPLADPCVDLTGQIAHVVHHQGCSR